MGHIGGTWGPMLGEQEAVAALRETWVTDTGAPRWDTLNALAQNLAEPADAQGQGGPDPAGRQNSSASSSPSYGEVLRRVLQSPEGRALRRILVDLDFRQLLLGLAGPQGALVRSAASDALAARLRLQKQAGAARAKETAARARAPASPAPATTAAISFQARQQERGQKALRVRSSAQAGSRCDVESEPPSLRAEVIRGVQLQRFRGLHALPLGSAPRPHSSSIRDGRGRFPGFDLQSLLFRLPTGLPIFAPIFGPPGKPRTWPRDTSAKLPREGHLKGQGDQSKVTPQKAPLLQAIVRVAAPAPEPRGSGNAMAALESPLSVADFGGHSPLALTALLVVQTIECSGPGPPVRAAQRCSTRRATGTWQFYSNGTYPAQAKLLRLLAALLRKRSAGASASAAEGEGQPPSRPAEPQFLKTLFVGGERGSGILHCPTVWRGQAFRGGVVMGWGAVEMSHRGGEQGATDTIRSHVLQHASKLAADAAVRRQDLFDQCLACHEASEELRSLEYVFLSATPDSEIVRKGNQEYQADPSSTEGNPFRINAEVQWWALLGWGLLECRAMDGLAAEGGKGKGTKGTKGTVTEAVSWPVPCYGGFPDGIKLPLFGQDVPDPIWTTLGNAPWLERVRNRLPPPQDESPWFYEDDDSSHPLRQKLTLATVRPCGQRSSD
ncbi:unnamed protein product [Symbiodinium sp. CCMP2592]|nr:unnamed protein product [Symbiodinium sp. CCMP2592]